MKFNACLAILVLALTTASSAVDTNRPEKLLRQDVKIESDRYVIVFNRFIASQIGELYSPNAVAEFPGSPPIVGRKNLVAGFSGLFTTLPKLKFTSVKIVRLGDRRYQQTSRFLVNDVNGQRTGTIVWTWNFIGARPYIVKDVTTSD